MAKPKKYLTEEERKAARKEYRKRWKEKNPDKVKEYKKRWRENNPDYDKQRYQENREEILERQKRWKEENPDYQKQWREENSDYIKDYQKRWREENPEKAKDSQKRWREENPEKVKECSKRYRQENAEKIKEKQKEYNKTPMGRAVYLVNDYQQSDKNANRGECTLTAQWIIDNIFTSKCHWCKETDWHKLGCDRINNDLPHTEDNVIPCCGECNVKRGTMNYEEFKAKLKV